tara:strand:- start:872 stop:1726 length:855 start_codon:yes stop_codon:yes gene_type:complete
MSAEVTPTTAAVYIPEIWSAGVKAYMERKMVLSNLVDTSLSSLVANRGDVFHIPKYGEDSAVSKTAGTALTAAASTHTESTLTVDQHKAVYKIIEQITMTQANPGLFEREVAGMGYALAKAVDTFVSTKLDGSASANDIALSSDNTISAANLRAAIVTLRGKDISPEDGDCFLVCNPTVYGSLFSLSDFADASKFGKGAPAADGTYSMIYGVPVYSSSAISSSTSTGANAAHMFHRSAVSLAVQQSVKVESAPSVSNLGTEVAAHTLYGGATVFDDRIVTFTNP